MDLGCDMGRLWVGAAGYADDLILLAPSRSAMKKIVFFVKTCNSPQIQFQPNLSLSVSTCVDILTQCPIAALWC